MISRRQFALGLGAATTLGPVCAQQPPVLADVHSHLGFFDRRPLKSRLLEGGMALAAINIVPDLPLLSRQPNGAVQARPAQPGEIYAAFLRMAANFSRRLGAEGLKMVLGADDLARVGPEAPSIVLAVEGADFIEGQFARLDEAYGFGIRQIGIAHFTESRLTDIRTDPPRLGGLSLEGRTFIERCNALGIVVDMAHTTDEGIEQAVAASRRPLLYSHGAIGRFRSDYRSRASDIMSISRDTARKLADRGGVVGIWGNRVNYSSVEQYAQAFVRFIEWVGEDHLALGTDTGGLGEFDLIDSQYGRLRALLPQLEKAGIRSEAIEKIAARNYLRLLKEVL